jgi:hypothetical protein
MVKLLKIIPSKVKGKKWTAYFDLGEKDKKGKSKEKAVSFGAEGYRDFVLMNDKSSKFYEKDKKQREKVKTAYRSRHAKDPINNPLTAGSLSYWLLWNNPTLGGSIAHFKNKFKLN